MTTPPDAALHAALDRADAALLARLSATRACPSDLLGRMVRHPAPRIRHLGLTLLAERLDEPGSGPGNAPGPRRGEPGPGGGATEGRESGQVDRLTRLLPDSPGSSPEESLLLARLHARIAVRRPAHRLPDWRAGRLPVRVRIAWLRAELLGDPAVLRTEPVGELLYRAVRESRAADAHRPDRLVAELVDRMPDRPPLRQAVPDAARCPLGRHPAGVRTGRTRLAFGRICGSGMPLYLRSGPGY
ncbi:hypothetical protein ACWEKU_30445 [Streptomyces californicus]